LHGPFFPPPPASLPAAPHPTRPRIAPQHFFPSILLRKIQSTKPEVTKFTRGGISVRNQQWGLEGAQGGAEGGASPTKRERPKWVDSTSSEAPAPAGRRGGAAAGGGGGGGSVAGRTRTFKDPANIA
jgi:hypothetical protein